MEHNLTFQNNKQFSDNNAALVMSLAQTPQLHDLTFNYQSELIDPFMHNYHEEHRVCPWPFIINEKTSQQMKRVVRTVPPIISKVLKHFQKMDDARFCEYLNISPAVSDLVSSREVDFADIPIRYDALVCDGDFKLVELNCGSSLGGWQMDWVAPEVAASLGRMPDMSHLKIRHHNVCESFFHATAQSIIKVKGVNTKGDILVYGNDPESSKIQQGFQKVYNKVRDQYFPQGQIYFVNEPERIHITSDGHLYCDGKPMDAILISEDEGDEVPTHFYSRVQSAALHGHFYYADDVLFTLFGNKLIFALMFEDFVQDILTEHERQAVQDYFPWTAKLDGDTVYWQGQRYPTEDFVIDNQHQLIIKKSHSMQGKGVHLGPSCEPEQWRELVAKYRHDPDWLIQAFCPAEPVTFSDQQEGVAGLNMVWGIFSLGGVYGGSFLRGVNASGKSSVINSANGAVEILIFEELKSKITL